MSPLDALVALGFPRRRLSLSLLRRLHTTLLDRESLRLLRDCLRDDKLARRLSHFTSISPALLAALKLNTNCSPTALDELAACESPATFTEFLEVLTQHLNEGTEPPRFASLLDIRQSGQQRRFGFAKQSLQVEQYELPAEAAQLSAWEALTFLDTPQALKDEGTDCQHCLGSVDEHFISAACGSLLCWHLDLAWPHTLAVKRRAATWELFDLRAFGNTEPSAQAVLIAASVLEVLNGDAER